MRIGVCTRRYASVGRQSVNGPLRFFHTGSVAARHRPALYGAVPYGAESGVKDSLDYLPVCCCCRSRNAARRRVPHWTDQACKSVTHTHTHHESTIIQCSTARGLYRLASFYTDNHVYKYTLKCRTSQRPTRLLYIRRILVVVKIL